MNKQYPMAVNLDLYITDGAQTGAVKYGFGFARVPTDEDMTKVIEKVIEALPPGFRLMNRAEAMMQYLREEHGYRGPNMIIPKDKDGEWFDPAADVEFSRLNDEPEADEED